MFEKRWAAVPQQLLTANGTAGGLLYVPDSRKFKVKQVISVKSNTQTTLVVQVNQITALNFIEVGPQRENIRERSDVSMFLVADGAFVDALEQSRVTIGPEEHDRAIYEEEPAVADRVIGVDQLGKPWNENNPLPELVSFIRDGVPLQVKEDTVTPGNNIPLPVKLTGVQGDVVIEADNLNLDVQMEGEYDLATNPKPDSVGIVHHQRGLTQDRTKQLRRTTAIRGSSNTDTVSQDVALHDHNGNEYTVANPVPVSDKDTHDKLDTIHSDLGAIDSDIDSVNTKLDTLHADNIVIEGKLDTLHSDLVTVEGKQDTGNASLASIDSKVSTAANQVTEIAALNTIHADLVVIEGKQDTGNTSLASIDSKLTTTNTKLTTIDTDLNSFAAQNHTDLLSIKSDIDSTNTKLDTIHSDLVTVEGKQDTGNASLASIDSKLTSTNTKLDTLHSDNITIEGKLDTIHSDLVVVEGKQDTGNASLASIDSKVSTAANQVTEIAALGTIHSDLVVVEGKQDTGNASLSSIDSKLSTTNTEIGATNETAPATDTASSGLNGRLQRIAQRLTTLIAFFINDYGASSAAIRTAAQIGNTTGAANFNAGATGAQTLRTASNLYDGSGNAITSRYTSGTTRALDVGIADGPQLDSYNRLRVVNQGVLFGVSFSNILNTSVFNSSLVGSGTLTLVTNQAAARLSTTTGATDSVIFESKRYLRYTPGISHQIMVTGIIGAKKTNVRQRWGFFGTNDGLFFEQTATDIAVVTRTSTSGSPVDTRVIQTNWNLDKLDGSGTSGITLDTTKHNVYIIDYVWQGGGRIRYGIMSGQGIVYFHQILNANVNTAPFMRTPSRPLRTELTNLGVTVGATNMDVVCLIALRETSNDLAPPYSGTASRGTTAVTVSTIKPLITLRPKATVNSIVNRIPIAPQSTTIITNQQALLVQVFLNATLTGASYVSAGANSAAEYDVSATVISGGTLLFETYVPAADVNTLDLASLSDIAILGLDIAGSVQDTLTISATSLAGNSSTWAQVAWQEFQ